MRAKHAAVVMVMATSLALGYVVASRVFPETNALRPPAMSSAHITAVSVTSAVVEPVTGRLVPTETQLAPVHAVALTKSTGQPTSFGEERELEREPAGVGALVGAGLIATGALAIAYAKWRRNEIARLGAARQGRSG